MKAGLHNSIATRVLSLLLMLAVIVMLQGATFGCDDAMPSHKCAMKTMSHHSGMKHDCCPRPSQKKTKNCCHGDALPVQACSVETDCCEVQRNTQIAKHEQRAVDQRVLIAVATVAYISSEPPPSTRAATLIDEGVRYDKPVFELKTDLRI